MLRRSLPVLAILLAFAGAGAAEQAATETNAQKLVESLPPYSWLRTELRGGVKGDGKDEPYRQRMRQLGIRRAFLQLGAVWRHGRVEEVRVFRRVYFVKYDGPHSQADEQLQEVIRTSGLAALLDEAALQRGIRSKWWMGPDSRARRPKNTQLQASAEFLDDSGLPERPTIFGVSAYGMWPLSDAAEAGDAKEVKQLLGSAKFSQLLLNAALLRAVTNVYDNSDVIDLLLQAGADINARTSLGQTALMLATGWSPTQVHVLLERGAKY